MMLVCPSCSRAIRSGGLLSQPFDKRQNSRPVSLAATHFCPHCGVAVRFTEQLRWFHGIVLTVATVAVAAGKAFFPELLPLWGWGIALGIPAALVVWFVYCNRSLVLA